MTARTAKRVEQQRAKFLATLEESCHVRNSAKAAGIPTATLYAWKREDEAFAAAWDEALDRGADALEGEAVRRARDGVERPVFQGGKQVGTVTEYSDNLLIFLLRGARPAKYGNRSAELGDGQTYGELVAGAAARGAQRLTEAQVDDELRKLLCPPKSLPAPEKG